MQTLREWVDNHFNKLSQVVVKADDGKDTVYAGLVGSLAGDMLNMYGNAEVLEVTKFDDNTKVLISGDA